MSITPAEGIEGKKVGDQFRDFGPILIVDESQSSLEVCSDQYDPMSTTPNCSRCTLSPSNGGDCPAAKT